MMAMQPAAQPEQGHATAFQPQQPATGSHTLPAKPSSQFAVPSGESGQLLPAEPAAGSSAKHHLPSGTSCATRAPQLPASQGIQPASEQQPPVAGSRSPALLSRTKLALAAITRGPSQLHPRPAAPAMQQQQQHAAAAQGRQAAALQPSPAAEQRSRDPRVHHAAALAQQHVCTAAPEPSNVPSGQPQLQATGSSQVPAGPSSRTAPARHAAPQPAASEGPGPRYRLGGRLWSASAKRWVRHYEGYWYTGSWMYKLSSQLRGQVRCSQLPAMHATIGDLDQAVACTASCGLRRSRLSYVNQ